MFTVRSENALHRASNRRTIKKRLRVVARDLLRTAVEQATEVLVVAVVQAGHARCVRLWQAPQPFQLPRHVAIRVIAGEMPCVEPRCQNEPAYVLPKLSTPTGLSGSANRSSWTTWKPSMHCSFSAERATRRRMRAWSRGA